MNTSKPPLSSVRPSTGLLQRFSKYWLFLGAIILTESFFTGLLPESRGAVFKYLELKSGLVWSAVIIYFLNYFFLDFVQAVKGYVISCAALFYREKETRETVLTADASILTYPQRIQEDIKLAHMAGITVIVEYTISFLIFLQLMYLNWDAPVLLVSAIAYAAISVLIAIQFNPRLRKAEIEVQECETIYRQSLSACATDLSLLDSTNTYVRKAKWIETEYLLFTRLQLGLINVLPYIVLIPSYFRGDIDMGSLMAHQAAFGLLVVNASILIQMYPVYIKGKASRERVTEITP